MIFYSDSLVSQNPNFNSLKNTGGLANKILNLAHHFLANCQFAIQSSLRAEQVDMDAARFKSKLETEEMKQAERYLKTQHKRADGALRETSQSLFSGNKGKDNAGVIYGGQQVRTPDGSLAITGKTATYVRQLYFIFYSLRTQVVCCSISNDKI